MNSNDKDPALADPRDMGFQPTGEAFGQAPASNMPVPADGRTTIDIQGSIITAQRVAVPRDDRYAPPNHHVLLMCHAGEDVCRFQLPEVAREIAWRQFINTAAEPPEDIYPDLDGPEPPAEGVVSLEPRSLVCYVAAELRDGSEDPIAS